jgi:hypothetical protein
MVTWFQTVINPVPGPRTPLPILTHSAVETACQAQLPETFTSNAPVPPAAGMQ